MENICYGRLDATDEEVIEAAKLACADKFMGSLPGGCQMEINEEASNISSKGKNKVIKRMFLFPESCVIIHLSM